MTESDRNWLTVFLLSCAFWLAASGTLKLDLSSLSKPTLQPTPETQRVDRMLALK